MKDVEWVGSSYKDLMAADEAVKDSVGYAVDRAQAGELAGYAVPIKGNLREVVEIRVPDGTGDSTYRAAYTTKIGDTVYFRHLQKRNRPMGSRPRRKTSIVSLAASDGKGAL